MTIEVTQEMLDALRDKGLVAVLAIVEKDYVPRPDPMVLIDGTCGGCGHSVEDHKGIGCFAPADRMICACERADEDLIAASAV